MSAAETMIAPQPAPPEPPRRFTLARLAGIVFMALWMALFASVAITAIGDFDSEKFFKYGPAMLRGLVVTVELVATSLVLGAILSVPLAFARMSRSTVVGTLAYAFRIAGVRTGHIAIAFALFNLLVLVSRLSNSFEAPFLAKRVENAINGIAVHDLKFDFALILASASLATLAGGILIPSVQRYASCGVSAFKRERSLLRLIVRSLSRRGLGVLAGSVARPRLRSFRPAAGSPVLPVGMILLNVVVSALWTVGVLAAIYAGVLAPDYRVTAASMSALVNGGATILMFALVDPWLAGLTDDVVSGERDEGHFRRVVAWMVAGRFAGTLLAQFLLLPAAWVIVWAARWF